MTENKSPAFQLYVQDFLMGTLDFTAEEVGGYIRLLCHQWDKGGLPNDDKRLLKLSGMKAKALENVKVKFIVEQDGLLRNARMEKVRSKQEEFRQKRIVAGSIGGQKRAQRMSEAKDKGDHRPEEWEEMKTFFPCCVRCSGTKLEIHKDHIVPIYQGGSNCITNIQPLCIKCNSSKGPETIDYRIEWCQANGKHMPSKWHSKSLPLQFSSSTSSSSPKIQNTEPSAKAQEPKKNVLKVNPKSEQLVVLPWESEQFSKMWFTWKEYRIEEKRIKFKTPKSELAQLKQLHDLANGDEQVAIKIIEQSIGNTWTGLFQLKNTPINGNQNKQQAGITPIWRRPAQDA